MSLGERIYPTLKNLVFLHTSVVPSSPGWHRREMGITASCLSQLWRQATRYDVMAEQRSCAFTRLFVMCDLQLPHCCFICDLVLPGQMAISCLTCPLCSCRAVHGKIKWHGRALGSRSGPYIIAFQLDVYRNSNLSPPNFRKDNHQLWSNIQMLNLSKILHSKSYFNKSTKLLRVNVLVVLKTDNYFIYSYSCS